jgi:hypothetical protein
MKRMTAEDRQAVARMGGNKGGQARAEKLTPEQRKEIARKAAKARWAKSAGDKADKRS